MTPAPSADARLYLWITALRLAVFMPGAGAGYSGARSRLMRRQRGRGPDHLAVAALPAKCVQAEVEHRWTSACAGLEGRRVFRSAFPERRIWAAYLRHVPAEAGVV